MPHSKMNSRYTGPPLHQWRLPMDRTGYYSSCTEPARYHKSRHFEPSLNPYFHNLSLNDDLDDMRPRERPPRYQGRHRPVNPKRSAKRHDRHRRRKSVDSSDYPDQVLEGRPSSSDENENIRRRRTFSNHREQPPALGKAMGNLFRQIERAEKFYHDFQSGYDEDVKNIKKYARKSILKALWAGRVQGRKAAQDESDIYIGETSENSFVERFRNMDKKVRRALNVALASTLYEDRQNLSEENQQRSKSRQEAAERLLGKVATANQQLMGLLEAAARNREDCQALLVELELLRKLIDPAVGGNRRLYRSGDDESGGEEGANEYGADDGYQNGGIDHNAGQWDD